MTTLLLIAAAALLLYGVFCTVADWLREQGRLEKEAEQLHADAEKLRKQAEVILERKTAEDTARDLDSGSF